MRPRSHTLGSVSLLPFLQRLEDAPGLAKTFCACLTPPITISQLRQICEEHTSVSLSTLSDDPQHPASTCYDAWLMFQFMSRTPWLALLILSTTVIDVCGEDAMRRAMSFQSVARTFRNWESEPGKLKEAERLVKSAPVHLECNVIVSLGVETEALRPMVELLKLMPEDLDTLRYSFMSSSERQLYLVAQLLTTFGVADQSLFQLKALIDSPMTSAHALVSLMSTNTPVVAAVPVENVAITPHVNPELKLILLKQCDDKTVYHKILKPYPTLELVGADNPEQLKLQAELYKHTDHPSDRDEQLPYLEGERIVPFKSGRQCIAYFKKLKFSGTSTQIGGHPFMLKFQVVRDAIVDGHKRVVAVPGLAVYSGPVHVYSHTTYLRGGPNKVSSSTSSGKKKSTASGTRKRERRSSDEDDDEEEDFEGNHEDDGREPGDE